MDDMRSARQEWRQFWYLPVTALLGYSTAVLHTYGLGPFIEPLQREFGWSRASISVGLTIAGLTGALLSIPVGMVVDRLGPRIVALVGVLLMPASIALLGTATGSLTNWYLLWGVVAFANLWLQSTVWTSAIASRFEASLGLALATTLAGASLSAVLLPVVATALIIAFDWRTAFMLVGAIWVAAVFPAILLFFRSAKDTERKERIAAGVDAVAPSGATVAEALRSGAFYRLVLASGFFTIGAVGVIVHFVPILTERGASPLGAAGIASIVGIFSFIGRLGTGLLLDRFSGRVVGACAFLLPVLSCLLLLFDGARPMSQSIAAALFGLTVGAEVDVIAYLTSRHFGLRSYGTIFGSVVAAMAAGGALGPLAAGSVFDIYGGYSQFLIATAALMLLSSLALATLRKV